MLALWMLLAAAEVEGEVMRAGTRESLAGASVALIQNGAVLTTDCDARGHFIFVDVPEGDVEVVAADGDHEPKTEKLTVKDGTKLRLRFFLRPRSNDPYSTVVIGKRDQTQVSQVTLTRPEIARSPGSFSDPIRAVQNMPGVARPALFLGTLNMRGTQGRDSQVMIEGLPIPTLYHLAIGPSVLPDMLVEDITFVPGAFGASYGRSIGGVVDVRLREPTFERLRGRVSIDLLAGAVITEAPLGPRTALTLAFRRSYIDGILAPIVAQQQAPIPVPQFTDYQVRLVHGSVDILFFGSFDNMSVLGNKMKADVPRPQWMFQALRPSWTLRGNNWSNRVSLMGVYVENDLSSPPSAGPILAVPEQAGAPLMDDPQVWTRARTVQWQGYLRDDLRITFSERFRLNAGADVSLVHDRVSSNTETLPTGSEDPQAEVLKLFDALRRPAQPPNAVVTLAMYSSLEATFGRLRLVPGVRFELFGFDDKWSPAIQPRLQTSFELHPTLRILGSVGYYEKPPAIETLATVIAPKTMASLQSALGVEWQITPALTASVTGYFNYLWRDVVRTYVDPVGALGYIPFEPEITAKGLDTQVNGRVYGGELFIRHRPYKNFFASLAYSFSRSERRERGEWVLSAIDQTHNLSVLASYVFPQGWQLGARFRVSSGPPFTSTTDHAWNNGHYVPIFSATRRNDRLSPYHQLDIRLDKTWVFDRWKLTAYLDLINVYFSPLTLDVRYTSDFLSVRPTSAVFPILPLLGVEGEF